MKKLYEVRGMMEWHPMFAVGRARIQVAFTGGHLGDGCCTPAKYVTSDPVVQRVIESSVHFRTGRIKLAAVSDDHSPLLESQWPEQKRFPDINQKVAPNTMQSLFDSPDELIEMEFDNYMKAAIFLQDEKGVDKKLLLENDSIDAQAKRCGIRLIIKNK